MSEILSTARPTALRLAGFVALAGGGLLLGLGALLDWVVLSFPAEIDPSGITAAPVRGVDVWEGKVVLGAAIVILVGTIATRLVASTASRWPIAIADRGIGLWLTSAGGIFAAVGGVTLRWLRRGSEASPDPDVWAGAGAG